jgi:hypothetical protein
MARRPVGRGGLLGTAARTAVVAGTATAVVGGVQRHQQGRAEEAAQQAVAQQAPPVAAAAPDPLVEIQRLADMKAQGILTDEEFSAAKAKLLGI